MSYDVPVRFLRREIALPKMRNGAQVYLWEGGIAEGKIIDICER